MRDPVQEAIKVYNELTEKIEELLEEREEAALQLKDAIDMSLKGSTGHLGDAAVSRSNGNGHHTPIKTKRSRTGLRRKDRSTAEREASMLETLLEAGVDGVTYTDLKKSFGTRNRSKGFNSSLKKLMSQGHLHKDGSRYFIGTPHDALYA